jgi:hypothetical protein
MPVMRDVLVCAASVAAEADSPHTAMNAATAPRRNAERSNLREIMS